VAGPAAFDPGTRALYTAVLRSDLAELLPDDAAAGRLARQTFTLAEFLTDHAPDRRPPHLGRSAITQTHCHQHAVMGSRPTSGCSTSPSCCGWG
jgi:hypothetical protein